jgi:predicted DNA-binding transcriptional regulator AlpA
MVASLIDFVADYAGGKFPQYLKGDCLMCGLLTLKEVCSVMKISPSTIKRRVNDAREGKSSFPLPIHGKGKKGLWVAEEINGWKEIPPNVPNIKSPAAQKQEIENDLDRLRAMGMKIGEEGNGETN